MQFIENKTFNEVRLGDSADLTRTLRLQDAESLAVMSGDANLAHVIPGAAKDATFHRVIAHDMWSCALISAVLGTELPGPGTVLANQSLRFDAPIEIGDTITARVTVTDKDASNHRIKLACTCINQVGQKVIEGLAEVIAPTRKLRHPRALRSDMSLNERGAQYDKLIKATHDLEPVTTAVVHPCDATSLTGAVEAAKLGLITPILIGPDAKIKVAADAVNLDLSGLEILDVPHSHAAAVRAVELVRAGGAAAIMKGKLHTDELMSPIINGACGLRTERRMSHIYMLDVPHYPKPLFITDAAINIAPDLWAKRDIVQNAIDLAQALGVKQPKVAVLSAVETITPKIASTMDAASLCKMADRGQITGGLVDGPLAFDNAISVSAAKEKGITSMVAGDADILVVPDLEAGNMIAKQLIYLAGAEAAGIVLGARVPVILTSRSDGTLSRLASCALAQLFIHHRAQHLL